MASCWSRCHGGHPSKGPVPNPTHFLEKETEARREVIFSRPPTVSVWGGLGLEGQQQSLSPYCVLGTVTSTGLCGCHPSALPPPHTYVSAAWRRRAHRQRWGWSADFTPKLRHPE